MHMKAHTVAFHSDQFYIENCCFDSRGLAILGLSLCRRATTAADQQLRFGIQYLVLRIDIGPGRVVAGPNIGHIRRTVNEG